MSEPFLGEIRMVGFNFEPVGWALCNGQLLSISQYSALFALLGTNFGGNGTTNFALPNLQSRVPVHQGQGPGLSSYVMGQTGGTETVALTQAEMPAHNHTVGVSNLPGSVTDPTNNMLAQCNTGTSRAPNLVPTYVPPPATGTLAPTAVSMAGGNIPHENLQPYLTVNFIIALVGIFPSRN